MAVRGRERTVWQDIYAIQQTSEMMDVGEYDADSDIGIMGDAGASEGRFLLKLTDHPHLQPAASSLEQELATGLAQRRQDDFTQVSSELAAVTLNMQAHAWNMSLFMRGLFQDGSREVDASLMNQVSMPYQIPEVVDFMAMTRVLDQKGPTSGRYPRTVYIDPLDGAATGGIDVDFTSHFMTGMVPRSIALTAEEGNILQMAVDCAGAYAGVQGVAGIIDATSLTTKRLRVYPTPAQLGEAGEAAAGATQKNGVIKVWIAGILVTNTYFRTSSEEFNAGGVTDSVEIAVDTGEMNFTSALALNGSWVQHDAYRTSAGTLVYRHPFELLPDLQAPLLWQNAQVKMRRMDLFGDHELAGNSWIDVKLPGFTLTFTNNLVGRFYNSPVLTKYLLGRLDTEGTVTIPWGTDKGDPGAIVRPSMGGNNSMVDFMHGVPSRLRIMWGQTTHAINASGAATGYTTSGFHYVDPEVAGAVAIDLAIRHTDQSVEGENELGQAMTFSTVDDLGLATAAGDAISPDVDKTISSRITIGYTKATLDRGQGGALEYPETTGPT